MATQTRVREELSFAVIDAIVHKHNVERGAAIPILQEIQATYGYIPPVAIERIAENMNVPATELLGIVTFYAQFEMQPPGKNIVKVCHGTACHLGGSEKISQSLSLEVGAREGETSPDGEFTVKRVACLGCCSLGPCMTVNGEVHGRLTPEAVRKAISQLQEKKVAMASK